MKFLSLAIFIASVAIVGGGCVDRQAQQQAKATAKIVTNPVQTVAVQPARVTTLTRRIQVTGQVTTTNDTQIGAKSTGRIVAVYVKDGDPVKSGEVVAEQDTAPAEAQLTQAESQVLQAEAGLATANSQLAQAVRNATVNPQKNVYGVQLARAELRSAQANLKKEVAGARPQEREQAQATLNSAKANLDVQQKQLNRIKVLVQQGALAGSQLDQQLGTYEAALAQYQNAQAAMSLIQQGNRPEDIAAAREAVQVAQENLRTAQSQVALDPLFRDQVNAAEAAVASARAQIGSAQAAVLIARQGVSDCVIRAPFTGKVAGKPIQLGAIAGPGTIVMRIVGDQGIYFEGSVPSDQISQIEPGMLVAVTVDALGSKSYAGHVKAVSPLGSAVGRLFTVRVTFDGAPGDLLPGMFARGNVLVQSIPNATAIPTTAIVPEGSQSFVFLADNGKAKKVLAELGLQDGPLVQVKNIPAGSDIIVQGQDNLVDGTPITIQPAVGVAATSSFGSHVTQG